MTEPYVGEIQLFGFNFNPVGWAFCNGAVLPISQHTALFSLLGVNYGGDGHSNFALPNFAARAGAGPGQGPGLSERTLGETYGQESVTLTDAQMAAHGHGANAWSQSAPGSGSSAPVEGGGLSFLAASTGSRTFLASPLDTQLAPQAIGLQGQGLPHANRQPYLGVNFCIALQGVYPSFG
ncbi:tail fiber protein [Luteimonas sp. RD2P54]|uniref:Tail fiber protein n=1 Tax=Luteimonas endophytica TaxID=3042023 RepID=A0ABT6J781_9GAMM|nr:tail fiber protein [Luteimonas endophytica]MDH5822686.1 tail fiber protein [Luteimonas endophytica]